MFGMWDVGFGMFAGMWDVDLQNAYPTRIQYLYVIPMTQLLGIYVSTLGRAKKKLKGFLAT